MNAKKIILTLFLLFTVANIFIPTQSYAISLDDDEEDMEDAEDYLQKAKQSANYNNFSEAESYLKKAKRLGVLYDDVKYTDSYVKRAEQNYEAQLERERQARLEEERKKEEAKKQAELSRKAKELMDKLNKNSQQSYTSSGSSSSSSKTSVSYICTSNCIGAWNMKRGGKISRVYTFSVSDPNSYSVPFEIQYKAEKELEDYCKNTWSFHDNKVGNGASISLVSCEREY